MQKSKLKRIFSYSLIIFFGLAMTYLFIWAFDKFVLGGFMSGILNMSNIVSILRPFIIGGVLAYIMKSTCNFFDRIYLRGLTKSGKRNRSSAQKSANILSLITTYVIWIAAISGLIWLAAEPLIESIKSLAISVYENVPILANRLLDWARETFGDNSSILQTIEQIIGNAEQMLTDWLSNDIPNMITQATNLIVSGITNIVGVIMDVLIGFVVSFLFLAGRKTLAVKCKMFVECVFKKENAKLVIDEFKYADKMFSGFLEGKIIDSTIVGVLYYIALLIMGVDYAPLIAVIGGVTNIIPIFGPFIGALPSSLIILASHGPIKMIAFIIFVCIMQFIDGYIIDPHIVGGNIKLSVFSVLFAVIFFGGLWGFWGLLVGVPVFAVIYDIGKKVAYAILRKRGKEHIIDQYEEKHKDKQEKETFSFRRAFRKMFGGKDAHTDNTSDTVTEDGVETEAAPDNTDDEAAESTSGEDTEAPVADDN